MAQQDIPEIELAYAFSIRTNNSGRVDLEGAMRSRRFEPAASGEIWGPKLQGRVVPQSGADFASNGLLDSHLMLQASDGTWIYLNQVGYEHNDTDNGEPYFRVTPYFDSPTGPYEWLSKTVFLGTGERFTNPNHTIIHYYEVL